MVNSVSEIQRLADSIPDKLLYNPLPEDFKTSFADYDEVVLVGGSITHVPGGIADRVKEQLLTFIMNKRKLDPLSKEFLAMPSEVEVVL